MNIRSRTLKIRNLPKGQKRLDCINSKPYLFLCLFLLLGITMLICKYYFLSLLFLVLFLYNFCFIKNMILVEFYEDYVIFYDAMKKDECYLLFWDDIAKWDYVHTKSDYDELQVLLKNNQKACIHCIGKHKTLRYFRRCAGHEAKEYTPSRKTIL